MSDSAKLDDIVSLAKRRGFIFPGSDVYGGLSGTWDYGPLGLALKRNIMNLWWKTFVEDRDDMYGVDAAILMNQKTWKASGHVDTFDDPIVSCGTGGCGMRYRADHLIESVDGYKAKLQEVNSEILKIKNDLIAEVHSSTKSGRMAEILNKYGRNDPKRNNIRNIVAATYPEDPLLGVVEVYIYDKIDAIYAAALNPDGLFDKNVLTKASLFENSWEDLAWRVFLTKFVKCQNCGAKYWSSPQKFNMMFKTFIGPSATEDVLTHQLETQNDHSLAILAQKPVISYDPESVSYLRPETAQGIFTNYKNVVDTFYPDVPFGIAQMGKAFRNEISPRDFVFRSREFEQMEIEYFVHPDNWKKEFEKWRSDIKAFLKDLGLPEDSVHEDKVPDEDRAHYSKRTVDFEFDFPHKRDELLGLAYRTDFDLTNIHKATGRNMEYRPKDGGQPFVPHVIEPSFGVERAIMAVLTSAYTEDEVNGEKRIYLKLPTHLAPVKVAVSPLLKNKPELVKRAREVYAMLKKATTEMPELRSLQGGVVWDDNGNIGKRYRRQDEIGTPYCVVIDFDTLEDNTVTVRNRDTTEQKRVNIKDLAQSVSIDTV